MNTAEQVSVAQPIGALPLKYGPSRAAPSALRRSATVALATIGLILGFLSGIVLIFAIGLVEFC